MDDDVGAARRRWGTSPARSSRSLERPPSLQAALRRGSALRAFADDMVKLPGIGAAPLDLLAQAAAQPDIVQEEAAPLQVDASDARETTGDTDSVDLTATGTLNLMLACHRGTPPMSVAMKTPGSVLLWATAPGSKRPDRFSPLIRDALHDECTISALFCQVKAARFRRSAPAISRTLLAFYLRGSESPGADLRRCTRNAFSRVCQVIVEITAAYGRRQCGRVAGCWDSVSRSLRTAGGTDRRN